MFIKKVFNQTKNSGCKILINMQKSVKIGVVQLNCSNKKEENLKVCKKYIVKAAESNAKIVFLPESFEFISNTRQDVLDLSESLNGEMMTKFRELAAEKKIYLSLGGFTRKDSTIDDKFYNTHTIINDDGEIIGVYDKLHLFDNELLQLRESKNTIHGRNIPSVISTPIGNIGLGICYDIRFPELSSAYREMGADVLTYPSAFTSTTGEMHWHILLRSRAIENQCFVIAAAQVGVHNERRTSYGHSIVVDPFGQIMQELSDPNPGLMLVDLNLNDVTKARDQIPCFSHKRHDLFPSLIEQGAPVYIGDQAFNFSANITIDHSCVFYRSLLSFAFVNISPLVPGHVLVCPLRQVERFEELTSLEVTDIYAVIKKIVTPLRTHFKASALTISQQDGKDAGQSVPHVHIHVLPRKPGDFEHNDDIYKKIQQHDKDPDRKLRSLEEMQEEAAIFRNFYYK